MEKGKSFKILLLSDAVMALNEGGICQTLYNLFSFVEPQNLLAIAPIEELRVKHPTKPFENRYESYKYTWLKIPHNRFTRSLLGLVEWMNFSICQLRGYGKLKKAIAAFDPDIIVSCPNSPIGVLMHKKLLNDAKYSKRVIPYFMDDWMYQSKISWLGGDVNHVVSEILTKNKRWIMISNELAEIFKERYHANPEKVLAARNPVDISNAPADKPYIKNDVFTIAYAGALWPMHFDSFYAFAQAVQQLSANTKIQLIWYGPQNYWDWRGADLSPLGVIYGGHVAYDKVHETLNKADALLITSSFKKEYYTHSKGSLQTKITDYCKAKRLIISCGPDYSANHNFIKQMNCGICIESDDSKTIAEKLNMVINSMDQNQVYVANGWESLKQFTKEVVHHDMQAFLSSAINQAG